MTSIEDLLAFLTRAPTTVRTLIEDLPQDLLHANEGDGTFSPLEVLEHLVQGEVELWVPRAEWIREHGPAEPFPPFDPVGFREQSGSRSRDSLLIEFEELRAAGLVTVRGVLDHGPELDAVGSHPALGEVTLAELIATWVVHDLNHIAQIVRVVANQFGQAVGPWRAYLPILHPREGST
jgi:hypothetical protein